MNESGIPKAEGRGPKEIRSPKPEGLHQLTDLARIFHQAQERPTGCQGRALSPKAPLTHGARRARRARPTRERSCFRTLRGLFGPRLSAFLRPSAFGLRIFLSALALLLAAAPSLRAQALSDDALAQIHFDQKPGAQVTPTLSFRDEQGQRVQLRQYFGQKPILLVLGYYECPMLCTLVLNGMVESAADLKWSIGKEYEVIDVSINPTETPALAAAKKRSYVRRYGRDGAAQGWHFLVGDEAAIRQLANEVGFRYAYDPVSKQFAHPSGLVFLTPEGKISGYRFGVTYAPRDLYASLQAASTHQVGSPIQQLILLCFHYNPITGKYSGLIIVILRVLGALTIFGFLGLIVVLLRRGRRAEVALKGNPNPETRNPSEVPVPEHAPRTTHHAPRTTQHVSGP